MLICDHRAPNRRSATYLQAINPLWWAGDVERPVKWSWWQHFKRNPFANFSKVIIGCAHKDRLVIYTDSPWTYAEDGWNHGWIIPEGAWFARPFWAFRGQKWERCIGWKTSGTFSIDWRRANSPNQAEAP
jgi:hypothetical protein